MDTIRNGIQAIQVDYFTTLTCIKCIYFSTNFMVYLSHCKCTSRIFPEKKIMFEQRETHTSWPGIDLRSRVVECIAEQVHFQRTEFRIILLVFRSIFMCM